MAGMAKAYPQADGYMGKFDTTVTGALSTLDEEAIVTRATEVQVRPVTAIQGPYNGHATAI